MTEPAPKKQRKKSAIAEQTKINEIKLFHKHIVEGKTVVQCAEEMGLSRRQLHTYKNSDDFRQMAIEHLENSKLKGLSGTVSKLVGALDATRPLVTQDIDGSTHITHVPDTKTRLDALKEVIKIYGLHAPERKDTTVTVTFSSDEDLYRQIDEAQRSCRFVESVERREGGLSVAASESGIGGGDFKSRQRALLQDDAVPESQ